MVNSAIMGPPLSPKEPRRSGRRSMPSGTASTSTSPDSDSGPRPKDNQQRPPLASNNSSGRGKRPKREEIEESVPERKSTQVSSNASTTSNQSTTNGRSKRRTKEKDKAENGLPDPEAASVDEQPPAEEEEEEEQGITRCICGSTEDDPDAGEFMVQCETCNAWQHGPCMGFASEDLLQDDEYYCEQCRPDRHEELLKKLARKNRHSSTTSHHTVPPNSSRLSRSHSPNHIKPSKRRNTMNSTFEENLKEILEATAAEAGATADTDRAGSVLSTVNGNQEAEEDAEAPPASRKKRKRVSEDVNVSKRRRSMSSVSDHPASSNLREETPVPPGSARSATFAQAQAKSGSRARRGGGRKTAMEPPPIVEGQEGRSAPPKRSNNRKGGSRKPQSTAASTSGHEHGTRRNQLNGTQGSSTAAENRAYRQTHQYVVSTQSLHTSWLLPDHLAHLAPILPAEVPQPLYVMGGGAAGLERTAERGAKVKWPGKRMSVGDMNKRVRALVEWVGREQAYALDRGRRKAALEKALREQTEEEARMTNGGSPMNLDDEANQQQKDSSASAKPASYGRDEDIDSSETMKKMEELMEELINFQEKYGPGSSKARERDKRGLSAS